MIYRVRPLACRGHASYDKRACADAMRRRPRDVPVSAPHVMVRGIDRPERDAVGAPGCTL